MKKCIGIRRENKNIWEKRSPLTPNDVKALINNEGLKFVIQASPIRIFKDDEYRNAGASISEDLSQCDIIFAVKELPVHFIDENKIYIFFSHTIKGQKGNMPMLKKIMETGSTLIDYERVTNEHGKRLIFFGAFAGLAGTIDTLWAYGQRLSWEKIKNPFSDIKQAHEYENFDAATEAISNAGELIETRGFDKSLAPLVAGIAGYGNVARGVQKVLTYLPITEIEPGEIAALFKRKNPDNKTIYKVIFKEEHTVTPVAPGAKFDLQDFYSSPEKYKSQFNKYLSYLSILLNCIYWDPRYPKLISKREIRHLFGGPDKPRLRVIGDISCDVNGGIEFTLRNTNPAEPVFVYDTVKDEAVTGVEGNGPVVLAVDNLPCELPRESSNEFSHVLKRFVPSIAMTDFSVEFEKLDLPPEIKKAIVVYRGKLTPDYKYLEKHINE